MSDLLQDRLHYEILSREPRYYSATLNNAMGILRQTQGPATVILVDPQSYSMWTVAHKAGR